MRRSGSSARAAPLLLLVFLTAPARADEFGDHYRRAEQLYEQGRYAESISALRAAYAIKPLPRLLLNIGQLHLKLRQPRPAIQAYEAYLRTAPEGETEAVAREGLRQARAQLPPPPAQAPRPPPERPLWRRWWFWGGLAVISAGVVTGTVLGLSRPGAAAPPVEAEIIDIGFRPASHAPGSPGPRGPLAGLGIAW